MIRLVTAALALFVFVSFCAATGDRWSVVDSSTRIVRVGIGILLGATVEGSIEAYMTDVPLGARAWLLLLAISVCAFGYGLGWVRMRRER